MVAHRPVRRLSGLDGRRRCRHRTRRVPGRRGPPGARISTEILFLGATTVYALFIPFVCGIDALDATVFVGLYGASVVVLLRGDSTHEPQLGVAGYLQRLPRSRRLAAVLAMFVFSAFVILLAVKPFAMGLETLGPQLGLSSFFMIQWFAPIASEMPEFIATASLVNKARTTSAFNALISSKLNQWTLLIGMLVVVYSVSLGEYGVLGFNQKQAGEIWLTAAQSVFAVVLLLDFEVSIREAVALLGLFCLRFLRFPGVGGCWRSARSTSSSGSPC